MLYISEWPPQNIFTGNATFFKLAWEVHMHTWHNFVVAASVGCGMNFFDESRNANLVC